MKLQASSTQKIWPLWMYGHTCTYICDSVCVHKMWEDKKLDQGQVDHEKQLQLSDLFYFSLWVLLDMKHFVDFEDTIVAAALS